MDWSRCELQSPRLAGASCHVLQLLVLQRAAVPQHPHEVITQPLTTLGYEKDNEENCQVRGGGAEWAWNLVVGRVYESTDLKHSHRYLSLSLSLSLSLARTTLDMTQSPLFGQLRSPASL